MSYLICCDIIIISHNTQSSVFFTHKGSYNNELSEILFLAPTFKKRQLFFIIMKTDDVLVKSSNIHDKGVFAARDFKAGEIVLRWDISNVLLENEVSKMTEEEKRYITFLDDKYVLMQEPERFVNHSCNANTTAKQFCDVAKRDIKKGEEITANYKEELPPNTYMKCNCGSPNCIGTITS